MIFQQLPDGRGKIYIPMRSEGSDKKHPCPDCFACLHCADDRCRLCRCCRPGKDLQCVQRTGKE